MTTDLCLQHLLSKLPAPLGQWLWIADENVDPRDLPRLPSPPGLVITNRVDIHLALKNAGVASEFNDFRLPETPIFDVVFMRVAKEKPVNFHCFKQAFRALRPGGLLCLSGQKRDGIKTLIGHAERCFGSRAEVSKYKPEIMVAQLRKSDEGILDLDDRHYDHIRAIGEENGITLYSKPGVFGWDKVDAGSRFLVDQLGTVLNQRLHSVDSLLDLGCGYGYLTLMGVQAIQSRNWPSPSRIVATDNNAAALSACAYNLATQGIQGDVMGSDCAQTISGHFDLILCNPPFHLGFAVAGDLTRAFVLAAKQHLAEDGQALFVTNAFIPIEKAATGLFRRATTLANNGQFKVLCLDMPLP